MAKILVTGASGLVGSRFVELSKFKNYLITPRREELDITKPDLKLDSPDVVVNFAADTDVSGGENQRDDKNGSCWQINLNGVQNLLNLISPSTYFIQISTDMVFSGVSGPYSESDKPETDSSKVTWYGFTKAEAERLVSQRENSAILRIIYPVRAKFDRKLDYLRKPLKLYDEGKLYPIFIDQQISISFIDEICQVIDTLIAGKKTGIFHGGSSDLTTPFNVISYLIKKARNQENLIQQGRLPESVRYPKFGGLKVTKTEEMLGIKFSTWKQIVDKLVEQGV